MAGIYPIFRFFVNKFFYGFQFMVG